MQKNETTTCWCSYPLDELLIATKALHASQGKIALCAMQNHIE